MTDIIEGEKVYQEFIEFRDMFLKKAIKAAEIHSTNMHGQKFRPVVVVKERQSEQWQALIQQWHDFAAELRKYPQLGIPKSLYEPEPKFIMGANRVICHSVSATNVSTVTVERVINDVTSMIARVGDSEDTKSYLSSLKKQVETLEALPAKTKLRIRRGGYEDLVCTYSTATEKKLQARVTASGVFFDDRVLRYGFKIGEANGAGRISLYDQIPELPITIYKSGKVYLVEDIERHTEAVRAEREVNAEQRKRDQWNRANRKRRAGDRKADATLKGAASAAGEQNPAGGDQE